MSDKNKQPTLEILANGSKEWRLNGKLHRLDGPAREFANGTKEWWQNGKPHREDGPACEYFNGSKFWWQKGQLHRLDGPAVEKTDGSKQWFINGKNLSESEFKRIKKLQPKEKPLSFFDSLIL